MRSRTKSILILIPALAFLFAAPVHAEHDYRNPSGWVDWRGTGFLVGPDLFMTCNHLGNIKGVAIFFDSWIDGVKQDSHYRVTVAEELWRGGGKADIALWRVSPIEKKQSHHYGKQIGDVVGFYEIDLQPPPAKDAAVFFGGGSHYSERHGKVLWTNDRYIAHNAQGSGGFSGSPTFVDGRSKVAGVYSMIVWGNRREDYSDRISYVWDDIKKFFVAPPAEPSIKLVEEWHGRNPLTLSGDASIQVRVPRVNLDYLHFVVAEDSALTGKKFEIDIPWNAAATGDAWCKSVDGQDWKEISVAAGNPIVLPYDELTFTRGQSHVSIQINMPEIRGKDRAADWEEGSYKDRRFSIRTPYFETFRYRFIFMGSERGDVNRDRFLSPHDAEHVPWRVWWR